jgi:hypothetical protein
MTTQRERRNTVPSIHASIPRSNSLWEFWPPMARGDCPRLGLREANAGLAHAVEKWAFLTNLRNLDIVSSYEIARLFGTSQQLWCGGEVAPLLEIQIIRAN